MKRLKLWCVTALLILLTSCGVIPQTPPNQVIRLAISQTLVDTQETLAQELGLSSGPENKPNFKINKLNINSRKKLPAGSLTNQTVGDVYRVLGTFRAELRMDDYSDSIGQNSPFEIYLGINPQTADSDVETWFLIKAAALR